MTFFRAHVTTDHFEFEAYGESEGKALAALLAGFRAHAKQYRITQRDWWEPYTDDIEVHEIRLGGAYRDRDALAD